MTKVLAVASAGGHWVQLLRLTPAFVDSEVIFVGVSALCRSQVAAYRFYYVNDASRWDKIGLVKVALKLAWIIWKERPDVIVSTGAAPGYFAILLGRLFRAKTIWLDSIANAGCLSMSGALAGGHADLWLTQWPHLERAKGPFYRGSVL
ncbi:MAG: UDP-N-acetylglucosamine--LPS N-acetylglucosamine transferase [Candidatus Acidiferrales bacterium]